MSDDENNMFGGFSGDTGSSSSGGSRSTKEYKPYSEGVVNLILAALESEGEDYIWPLKTSDAAEIPDGVREQFDLPDDVTHFAVEQFAPFEIDSEGIGTPVNVSYEQLQESVEAGYLSEDELEELDVEPGETVKWAFDGVESTPQTDLAMCLNGFFADEIIAAFGDDAKVRVMAAKKNHPNINGAHERYTNVRYYVSRSKQAPLSRERARLTVGEITKSEFEEWAESHGFEDKV